MSINQQYHMSPVTNKPEKCTGNCKYGDQSIIHGNSAQEVIALVEQENAAKAGGSFSGAGTAYKEGNWGKSPDLKPGSNSPWGEVQEATYPAEGITVVSTDGHGGVKLSKERNQAIPAPLRSKNRWYEEDVESQIVGYYHPEAFPHYTKSFEGNAEGLSGEEAARQEFEKSVKNWYPREYSEVTGNSVSVNESSVLRREQEDQSVAEFREANSDKYIADTEPFSGTIGGYNRYNWVPERYRVAEATRPADNSKRYYLVEKDELYPNGLRTDTLAIDENKHLDITEAVQSAKAQEKPDPFAAKNPVDALYGDDVKADYSKLTAAQAKRAEEGLNKRYRWNDGQGGTVIMTKLEKLQSDGVFGKSRSWGEKSEAYYANLSNGSAVKLSASEFKALDLEDTTSDYTSAAIDYYKADKSLDRAKDKKSGVEYLRANHDDRKKIHKSIENAEKKHADAKSRMNEFSEQRRNVFIENERAAEEAATEVWENSLKQKFEELNK